MNVNLYSIKWDLVSKKKFKNNLLENWEFKTQNNEKIPAYFIKPKDKSKYLLFLLSCSR